MAPHPIWLASLYKKEIWTHRLEGVHTQRKGHVRTQQEGKASANQGEKSPEKPNLLTPWCWTSSLQHCGKDGIGQKVCSGSLPNTFLLSYPLNLRYFVKAAPANEHRGWHCTLRQGDVHTHLLGSLASEMKLLCFGTRFTLQASISNRLWLHSWKCVLACWTVWQL